MTEYRIKQRDTNEFYPQKKNIFGIWVSFTISECHYGGCYNTKASFISRENAAAFLAKREADIAIEKERRRRRREDYPKYFDWP